jgi:hypothetical protein
MDLTPEDRHRAAMACRAAAHIAEQDAAKQSNPSIRVTFEQEAKKYRELANRFDLASQNPPPISSGKYR